MATHTSPNPIHWFGRKFNRTSNTFKDLSDTESFKILKGILKNGFMFSHCKEIMPISSKTAEKLNIDTDSIGTGSDMICFTDIPYDKSEFHRSKYGSWGLEMSREWLIKNGGQPVIYRTAHEKDALMHRMLLLWKLLYPGEDIEYQNINNELIKNHEISNILRQITSDFFFSAKHIDHEIFQMSMGNFLEREWRINHQPPHGQFVTFEPKDVVTIFYSGSESFYEKILDCPEFKKMFFNCDIPVIKKNDIEPHPTLRTRS